MDEEMSIWTKLEKPLRVAGVMLVPAAVLVLFWIVAGSNPFWTDAWKSGWNAGEELGVARAVRAIHSVGSPMGHVSFNEQTTASPALGHYNIFTYMPYALVTLLLHLTGHNFIYLANFILLELALFVVMLLLPPEQGTFRWYAAFFAAHLLLIRISVSGLAEGSFVFYLLIYTALAVWFQQHPSSPEWQQILALAMMVLMTFFWSTMRISYAVLFLIPVYFLLRTQASSMEKSAKRYLIALTIVCIAGAFILYNYFDVNSVAHQSPDDTAWQVFSASITSVNPLDYFWQLMQKNMEEVLAALSGLGSHEAGGALCVIFAFQWGCLVAAWISLLRENTHDGTASMVGLFLISGLVLFESAALSSGAKNYSRALLPFTAAAGILLIEYGQVTTMLQEIVIIAISATMLIGSIGTFTLPERDADYQAQALQEVEDDNALRAIIPVPGQTPGSEEEREAQAWQLTVAVLSQAQNLRDEFVLPDYVALSTCSEDYLRSALSAGSLRSSFVLVPRGTQDGLDGLCAGRYTLVWSGKYQNLYKVR